MPTEAGELLIQAAINHWVSGRFNQLIAAVVKERENPYPPVVLVQNPIGERIGKWHLETFGACSNKRIARKLLEECAEFMVAQSYPGTPQANQHRAEEAADVLMVLIAWAHRNQVDLLAEVEKKFNIVKNRDQKARDE